jgi:hypothetical protein
VGVRKAHAGTTARPLPETPTTRSRNGSIQSARTGVGGGRG